MGGKAELGVDTIFYIFMGLVFAWVLIFGFSKIFLVKDVISDQDRVEIIRDIKGGFEYCEDPLNKGSFKNLKIKHKAFNGIYLVGSNITAKPAEGIYADLKNIREGGDNIVFFYADFYNEVGTTNITKFNNYHVVDSFNLDVEDFTDVFFFLDGDPNSKIGDTKRDGRIIVHIECE